MTDADWWQKRRRSENVEERLKKTKRAAATAAVFSFMAGGGLGWCGKEVQTPEPAAQVQASMREDSEFAARILGDNEDIYKKLLGARYRAPKLIIYAQSTATKGCGTAQAAIGPFYCPDDERIYIDNSFWQELKTSACSKSYGSDACEFGRAYIIAHEHGHHLQQILGTLDKAKPGAGPTSDDVKVELQADCFAGVWAGHTSTKWKDVTRPMMTGAWQAARFGGDDRFGVPPSEFTHGTSAQRTSWFLRGHDQKTIAACDTFRTPAGEL